MNLLHAFALVSIAAWVGLMGFRGWFWRADQRMDGEGPELERWPEVVAVIPARNEAETVGPAVSSLLGQNYPGVFSLVLVDDGSDDGTAEVARRAAADGARLTVVAGKPLELGWTGKLWAMSQGLRCMEDSTPESEFVLFTDADITHHPLTLRWLVGKALIRTPGLGLGDGSAPLSEPVGTLFDAGIRLFFPEALSLLPGQRP